MAFLLRSASYKAQTAGKAGVSNNADTTFTRPWAMAVLDGVGGVSSIGLAPETFPMQLRDGLRNNLSVRNARIQHYERERYDNNMRKRLRIAPSPVVRPGEWLKNLVGASILECSEPGSTCLAAVSMLGNKMSYVLIGDVGLYLFRKDVMSGTLQLEWKAPLQRDTILPDGRLVPNQVYMPEKDSFTNLDGVKNIMDTSGYNVVKVLEGDIIVMGSDGLWENLPGNDLLVNIRKAIDRGDDPYSVAEKLVRTAIGAGIKEDDVSCAVGFVSRAGGF